MDDALVDDGLVLRSYTLTRGGEEALAVRRLTALSLANAPARVVEAGR